MAISRSVIVAVVATLCASGPLAAQAQTGTIVGTVKDVATTMGLANTSVAIEGTRRGTTTAADGSFVLADVPVGIVRLVARSIGYAPVTHEITVTAGQPITVEFVMERQAAVMDEIVVTGYGSQRRAEITGSISTVDGDAANVGVVENADKMLQGRVSGLNVQQNTGDPGAGMQLRVRGGTSISGSDEPLYVIDGVVIQNQPTEPGGVGVGGGASPARNPLSLINPSDIKSITVLKDAGAAAIYGARGANGVILIETKQGERDQVTFEYDGYVSFGSAANSLGIATADQYRQFIQEQVAAGNLPAERLDNLGSANTNWENEVLRSTLSQNHNVSFSGGSSNTTYRASLNYQNVQGAALSSGLERFQGRLNARQYAWNDRLQLGLNLTASHIDNNYVPFQDNGGFEGDLFQNMVVFNPTRPVKVTDTATGLESYYEIGAGRQSVRNPVALAEQLQDFGNTTRVLGNIRAQLDITSSLQGQVIVGVDRSDGGRKVYYPAANPVGAEYNGLARRAAQTLTGVTFQGLMNWSQDFAGVHTIAATGGYEFQDFSNGGAGAETRDFLTDAFSFDNLGAGANVQVPYSYLTDNRVVGFFGRVVYGYKDRYYLTGVVRRDGSSRFGADSKWGTFPAISASWRLSQERFLENGPFSELRFRAGYGLQGNDAAASYASLVLLSPGEGYSYPFGDQKVVGVAPSQNPNPNLKWEQTATLNFGLDFGFSDQRITGSIDYYKKDTKDLLLEVTVPQPAPVGTRLENIGQVRNSGIDAQLDALLVTSATFSWQAGLVFSTNKNQVVDLGGRQFITTGFVNGQGQTGQTSQRLLPGEPLGTYFGPEYVGTDPTGRQLFNDYDADGTLIGETTTPAADDFQVLGHADPDFTAGIRTQVTFGRFDAGLLLRWEQGGTVFNNTALVYSTKSNALQDKNFLASALDDPTGITQPAIYSSRWLEGRSFLRLQNITLGFTFDLPGYLSGLGNSARLYASADNLFLLTGYSGYDPEVLIGAQGIAARGVDYLNYPRQRVFTTGVRLSF
ncbi:MAG: SusC/RagA family TonB-linked outer membrane protein [Gemmatimonadota bacterium]|nr:SusC/RagA family TonB-linked outer membrane protein [Gemmatimonadota bacterium]